jgi:tetratricopeptide (TPR) repeat protein
MIAKGAGFALNHLHSLAADPHNSPGAARQRMTGRGKTLWVLAVTTLAGAAAAVLAEWRAHAPRLPERTSYEALPAAFGTALQAARQKVLSDGFAAADVRELARLYQANRLDGEARACYAILGRSAPGLGARDHYYLADMAASQGDLEQAEVELREATTLDNYLPAHLELGEVLLKSGKPLDAAKEYEATLALVPRQPQAMFGLARLDLLKGDDTRAIARLEELLTAHPEMTSGAALLAQIFDRRGEKERAELMGKWAREKPEPLPEDPWMDALLAYSFDIQRLSLKFEEYLTSGEIDHAVPLLGRVEELDPKSPIPQLLRGWSEARDHNDAEAVRQYRMALDKGGDPERICPYMVQSLIALDRVADAESLMAEFYAKKPDSVPLLISYADVAVRRGDNAMAKTLLRKVLVKEPYRFAANMNLAKILWADGERDEAAACLERAAKVSSSDIPSRALLAEYHLARAQPLLAIPYLEQALTQALPGMPGTANLQAMLYGAYIQAGDSDESKAEAATIYDKATRLGPSNPVAFARRAAACAATRDFGGAAQALEKLETLQPGNPTVYLSLGDVLYQAGDAGKARSQWQKALDLTSTRSAALRDAIRARLTGPVTEDTFR